MEAPDWRAGEMAIAQPDRTVGQRRPRPFAFVTFCGPASKVWQSNVVSTRPFWGFIKANQSEAHTHTRKHTEHTGYGNGDHVSRWPPGDSGPGHWPPTTDHWRPTYV